MDEKYRIVESITQKFISRKLQIPAILVIHEILIPWKSLALYIIRENFCSFAKGQKQLSPS